MWGASGASAGASTRQCGVASRQGAENSALKNIAPFIRTPLRTSENASIAFALPAGVRAKFPGVCANTFYGVGRAVKETDVPGMVTPGHASQNRLCHVEVVVTSDRAVRLVLLLSIVTASSALPLYGQPSLS